MKFGCYRLGSGAQGWTESYTAIKLTGIFLGYFGVPFGVLLMCFWGVLMKKRLFILFIITASVYVFMISAISSVSSYRNLLLLEFTCATGELNLIKEAFSNNGGITGTSIYKRHTDQSVSAYGRKTGSISVYEADEALKDFLDIKLIEGRFIWNTDSEKKLKYVVLDSKSAIELFAAVQCIGQSVRLLDTDYVVVGVYDAKESLLSELSAVELGACFIPSSLSNNNNIRDSYIAMLRVRESSSFIMVNTLKSFFKNTININVNIDNVDAKIRAAGQKITFVNMFILFLALIYLYKALKVMVSDLTVNIKKDSSDFYPVQLMIIHSLKIIYAVVLLAIMILLVSILLKNIFSIYINPSIIPERIINTGELYRKLKDFMINANTAPKILSEIAITVDYVNSCINYSAIILVMCITGLIPMAGEISRSHCIRW